MRDPLKVIAFAAAVLAMMACPAAAGDESVACTRHLTFRWTSGEPIRLDVSHPAAASLANPPFLTDPSISSVSVDHDWNGPEVSITVGSAAADVLAAQSATHIGQQMLVMLGDTVIIAVIARDRLGRILVLHTEDRGKKLDNLIYTLRSIHTMGSGVCKTSATSPRHVDRGAYVSKLDPVDKRGMAGEAAPNPP